MYYIPGLHSQCYRRPNMGEPPQVVMSDSSPTVSLLMKIRNEAKFSFSSLIRKSNAKKATTGEYLHDIVLIQ